MDDEIFDIIAYVLFAFVGVVSKINVGYFSRGGGDGGNDILHEVEHGEGRRWPSTEGRKEIERSMQLVMMTVVVAFKIPWPSPWLAGLGRKRKSAREGDGSETP